MTITWGNYEFTGPSMYTRGIEAGFGGVYAIMVIARYKNTKPRYRIIYFGQTHDFSERLTKNHHAYDCFKKESKKYNSEIFRGLYFMEDSTEDQRKEVESELIQEFEPICNNT